MHHLQICINPAKEIVREEQTGSVTSRQLGQFGGGDVNNWRSFHTLAGQLRLHASDMNPHQPAPLIAALSFDSVEAFVTGPTNRVGLGLSSEKWLAR